MGVHVDPLAFGLFQNVIQILQIVAGNKNGLAFFGTQRNRGGHGMAVGPGIGRIQQFHGPQVDLPALERQTHIRSTPGVVPGRGKALVDKGVYLVVFLPQDPGVIGIGGDPLDAVDRRQLERMDIRVQVGLDFTPTASPCSTRPSMAASG